MYMRSKFIRKIGRISGDFLWDQNGMKAELCNFNPTFYVES